MPFKKITPLKCSWMKLSWAFLVYFLMSSRMCSGASQLGHWTDWSVCQCAIVGTEGFSARFRKPVPGSGMAYKCHLDDEECIQFEPCSCIIQKYAEEIKGDHRNNASQIPADHGTPNESVAYSFLDRMRNKRNAYYDNYNNYNDYYNDDYGNYNYREHTNTGRHFESYQGNENRFQPWNTGNSNQWDDSRQKTGSHRNEHFDYNEYYGYGNQNYDNTYTGFTTSNDKNYYDRYQYGATYKGYPGNSYAYRANTPMKHTATQWNVVQGSNGDRNRYQNYQSYDGYGQMPDLHYPRDNAYYGYKSDAYVAQDVDDEDIPVQTVVRLQSSQQQILEEIRKLNERLQQSKEVMAHFTNEIEHLEDLEASRQDGFSK